jgi:hypothetical protein
VKPDAKGRYVARKHNVYPCTVYITQPKLPASMTKSYGFKWPLGRSRMQPDEGRDCPFHEAR